MKKISTLCLFVIVAVSVQGQFAINDSLQGWYLFSSNALDSSGNGNDGTLNGPILTTDRFGAPNSAYEFDGVNDAIELPSDFDYPERTVLLWFNADVIGFPIGVMYNSDHNNLIYGKTSFDVEEIGGINYLKYRYGGATCCNYVINENQWYMVAITVGDSGRYYLDDNLVHVEPLNNVSSISGNNFASLGKDIGNDRFFNGKVDDVRIYNRAIDWCEVRYLYHGDSILPTITVNGFDLTSSGATSYQWNLNDTAINGATSINHTALQNGSYTVTVIDSFGCEYTSLPVIITGVGINQSSANNNQFFIYPNPTTGQFTIQGATGTITVHDLFGRLVLTANEPQTLPAGRQVDMGAFPKGVYFVRLGEAVRKLVLQ